MSLVDGRFRWPRMPSWQWVADDAAIVRYELEYMLAIQALSRSQSSLSSWIMPVR